MISKMLRFILIGDYNDVKYSKKKFDHFNMVFFKQLSNAVAHILKAFRGLFPIIIHN